MTTQPTAAERIEDAMRSREATLAALYAVADDGAGTDEDGYELTEDEARERIFEMPLSVEVLRHLKILLGTGGPADWLDVTLDDDRDVTRVVYHFVDWFDGAETDVLADSPLWRLAEEYAEYNRVV